MPKEKSVKVSKVKEGEDKTVEVKTEKESQPALDNLSKKEKKVKKEKREKKSKKGKAETDVAEAESKVEGEGEVLSKDTKVEASVKEDQGYDFGEYILKEAKSIVNPIKKTKSKKGVENSDEEEEGDGLKIIEPKVNKKKLTVDDITERDLAKAESLKRKLEFQEKNAFGIWVGNLRYSTTEQDLREFFSQCGEVVRLHMPLKQSQNQGYAYVNFSDEEAQTKAIKLSETSLNGRNLLIKGSKVFKKTGKPTLSSNLEPTSSLFVGNLSFECTKQDLIDTFGSLEKFQKVRISTFQDTGRSKGYAWIDFEDSKAAEKALRDKIGSSIKNRKMKMEFAQEAAAQRAKNRNRPLNEPTKPREEGSKEPEGIKIVTEPNPNRIVFE